jgi:PadR family transcriptional regulator, regulatory protein PadR
MEPSMMKMPRLGEFEEIVLLAILNIGSEAYGVSVQRYIEAHTRRRASFGALYTTFDRLEKKGFISSYQGGATKERGGRAKRYLKVEPAGLDALRTRQISRAKMLAGLEPDFA